jgi:hypothetical protein
VLTFVALGGEGKTSLVAKWAADLAHQGWPGCDAVFAWSFYSQGTREQVAASSDLFLNEALTFFGDAAMADSAQGAYDKGRRLDSSAIDGRCSFSMVRAAAVRTHVADARGVEGSGPRRGAHRVGWKQSRPVRCDHPLFHS